MSNRDLKKDYEQLWRDPEHLFPGVQVFLCHGSDREFLPAILPEIVCKTKDGLGFTLRVVNGQAGLGLTVQRLSHSNMPLTVTSRLVPNVAAAPPQDRYDEVMIVQYGPGIDAQKYKAEYTKLVEYYAQDAVKP